MKKTLISCSFIFYMLVSHAQAPENDKLRIQNQIGINATNFIKAFLTLSNTAPAATNNVPVFSFNYKLLFSNKFLPGNLKYGVRLGANYSNNQTDNSSETTFDNSDISNNAWRAGIELQQDISKHWVLYYGIDYFKNNNENHTETKFLTGGIDPDGSPSSVITKTDIESRASGFGPVIGVQFNINKYICLSTETSLYFLTANNSSKTVMTRSDGFPVNNQPPSETKVKQQTIALPAFINFSVMF